MLDVLEVILGVGGAFIAVAGLLLVLSRMEVWLVSASVAEQEKRDREEKPENITPRTN